MATGEQSFTGKHQKRNLMTKIRPTSGDLLVRSSNVTVNWSNGRHKGISGTSHQSQAQLVPEILRSCARDHVIDLQNRGSVVQILSI